MQFRGGIVLYLQLILHLLLLCNKLSQVYNITHVLTPGYRISPRVSIPQRGPNCFKSCCERQHESQVTGKATTGLYGFFISPLTSRFSLTFSLAPKTTTLHTLQSFICLPLKDDGRKSLPRSPSRLL
ncbi:hypothetical protein F5887DRAFT_233132 [Amanita rubescens]|nr:hypothetical protein F5887DRAFT_233132 [Amanita rubescens]